VIPKETAPPQFTNYRREAPAAQKWAETVIVVSSQQGFPQLLTNGASLNRA